MDVEHQQRVGQLFGPLPPEMRDDTAFMDRIHSYIPGWDVPKMGKELLTDHFDLMSDFLSECFSSLRNYMDADFCVNALEEALDRYGAPEIFNTDQGSQFTSEAFTGVLHGHGIRISMDGKGCYRDNIFVERLWRSVKYECVYLKAFDKAAQLKQELKEYFLLYNSERPHQGLNDNTRSGVFQTGI